MASTRRACEGDTSIVDSNAHDQEVRLVGFVVVPPKSSVLILGAELLAVTSCRRQL